MLAIQHIDNRIRKEVFFSEIDNGLDFPVFRAERAKRKRLMDYKDRIRMFACVYQILKAGHCFYVPNGQIPASDVKVDYIIYQLIDGKGSNLGIRYVDDEYIPLTLLINRAINPNEIIQKLTRVNMKKLEIIENQQVIETITYQEG